MGVKIIVESGATKSEWCVVEGGRPVQRFLRAGTNVSTMRMEAIKEILREAVEAEGLKKADGFYFYTAGVVTKAIDAELKAHIRSLLEVADVDIQNDLMAAARGLCGRESGIVGIIGTGSNTCFYDGANVSQKVYAGGYVIGDDGGAAVLGKLFLSDYIKGLVPEPIASAFAKEFDASYAGIVEGVYRSASPSGYLGSLAPFLLSQAEHPYAKDLIEGNFQAFIDRSLLRYDVAHYPVGITGGLGYACQGILSPLLEKAGIRVSRFLESPIEGLIDYHSK